LPGATRRGEASNGEIVKTYGKQKFTFEQLKAELEFKTTWGSSVIVDLVHEIERLQQALQAAGLDCGAEEACVTHHAILAALAGERRQDHS
jgi:hypothetical protein